MSTVCKTLCRYESGSFHLNPAHRDTVVVKGDGIVSFLRTKRKVIDLLFARKPERLCRMFE